MVKTVSVKILFISGFPFPVVWVQIRERLVNEKIQSDFGPDRNTRGSGYRCSVPGLAGFTEPALCGARSLMQAF